MRSLPRVANLLAVALVGCLLAGSGSTFAFAGRQDLGALAFTEVGLIPMDTEQVLTRHTVIVEADRIVTIGPADEIPIPDGATIVDGRGKYLIPGLIDAHAHLLSDRYIADEYADAELGLMVANGVTTVRDPTGTPNLLEQRELIAAGEMLGPTLFVGGPPIASGDVGPGFMGALVQTPFEASAAVREIKQAGYDFVTLSVGITPEIYEGVILTARGSGIPVIGLVGPQVGLGRALEARQQIEYLDQYIEALLPESSSSEAGFLGPGGFTAESWARLGEVDEDRIESVVRATVDAEIWNTPALAYIDAAFGNGVSDAEIESSVGYRFLSPGVRAELTAERRAYWADPPEEALRIRYVGLRNRLVRALFEAGGKLMAGSGSPSGMLLHGHALHRELESLVAAGLTPYAVLWAATRSPASFLSWGGAGGRTEFATVDEGAIRFATAVTGELDFGRIAVGKRADMVLLGANPLDDISNTRDIDGVVLGGRWLPRGELDDILDRAAAKLSTAPLRPG